MAKILRFPGADEVELDVPSTNVQTLLYAEELREVATTLLALERRDGQTKVGFAPPVGTLMPISSDGGTHVGDCIKTEQGVWGFLACMQMGCI